MRGERIGQQIADRLSENQDAWAQVGESLQRTLSYNLTRAIASGDWSSIGQIFIQSITETLIGGLVQRGVSSVFGGLFGGIFHQGGVVPGSPSEERLILAQGGETVYPVGATPGGVNLTLQVTGDVTDATRSAIRGMGRELTAIIHAQAQEERLY